MRELHLVLKSTLEDGSHEQLDIFDCGIVAINDNYIDIYSGDDSVLPHIMGSFDLAEIIGYWIEES